MSAVLPGSRSQAVAGAPSLWLGLLVCAWFAATAGWRALSLPDEGRYVGVAWEMLRAGQWAVPTLDGLPFFHKPPLFYWITAASLKLAGLHAWSARVASIVAATVAALALHRFTRRWSDLPRARSALVALASQPLFYGAAQYANLDMLVAACITLSILAFADAVLSLSEEQPARGALMLAWGAAALGVLAKGLIGIVLPVLVIALWTAWQQRGDVLALWRRLAWWPAIAGCMALTLPWFIAMEQRHPGFLRYFVVEQHFHRYAGQGFNNVQPFWFCVAALALLCLPWTPWALWSLRWRPDALPSQQRVRALMITWLVVVLAFFSWPASKMVGYILPACIPLAWLCADAYRASESPRVRRAWQACALVALLLGPLSIGWFARHQAPGNEALARVLRETSDADRRPLVFVGTYPYDLMMLSGREAALVVIDDWHSPAASARDDWRKELADAARFATPDVAVRLVSSVDLPARLCGSDGAWVVTGSDPLPGWLAGQTPLQSTRREQLWLLDAEALRRLTGDCPRTPNGAPASR